MDEQTTGPTVSRLDLLFLTRAYNRHEITLEEWMRLSKAWAEAMERQYRGSNRTPSMPSRTPAAPD